MKKKNQIRVIRELYEKGSNLMEYLRIPNQNLNTPESIMISYDFQAGSYTKIAEQNYEYFELYTDSIIKVFNELGNYKSIMEVGVGEATILTPVFRKLSLFQQDISALGFDISWSRVHYARKHSALYNFKLFTADLFNIPIKDNSIDIVYTSHSLEPNGGREQDALKELVRVASKYVVLLEPSYEHANAEGRQRMEKHGYIRNIEEHAKKIGLNVIEHRLFDHSINPLNPTALTIIQKKEEGEAGSINLVCPITKSELIFDRGVLYSEESLMAYPVIDHIPCLLEENGILASRFKD